MKELKVAFLSLLLVCTAVAQEAEPEEANEPPELPAFQLPETPKSTLFSLASARAEGRELTTVELLVDAYINLLDIMSKDDGAPDAYDEEDVLRQYSEYENPYVAEIIKAFEDDKPTEEGNQRVERLAKKLEDHFTAQGFEAEEHRSVLDRHELFGKVSTRLVPPKQFHVGDTAFENPGHFRGEL